MKRILVNGELHKQTDNLIPPLKDGHRSVEIEFVDMNGENTFPESNGQYESTIKDDGSVKLQPSPNSDRTEWKLPSGHDYVKVAIELQRIWWKIENQEEINNDWCDKPIAVPRKVFHLLGKMDAKLKFLPKNTTKSGKIGLDNKHNTINVKLKDSISLSEFLDFEKISDPLMKQTTLKLFIEDAEVDLISIEPDPNELKPRLGDELNRGNNSINPERDCGPRSDNPFSFVPPIVSKCAWVRKCGNNSYHMGKGFSEGELAEARITVDLSRLLNLSVDKRRNTTHQHNIDILMRIKEDAKIK